MRFVVDSPQEHSLLGTFNRHMGTAASQDDSVVAITSCPVRRGTANLVAAVTKRMRFHVFSIERTGVWSRRVLGQLPVATGAVTEGNQHLVDQTQQQPGVPGSLPMTPLHGNISNKQSRRDANVKDEDDDDDRIGADASTKNNTSSVKLAMPSSNSRNSSQTDLRMNQNDSNTNISSPDSASSPPQLVESPISIHFNNKGRRIVIATSVRRLLILEIDAEQGTDTTPLAHQKDVGSPSAVLTAPLPNMQSRWCVTCEVFIPQGLIQSVETASGNPNVFCVTSSSGHIFVVSWLNGTVLHEMPIVDRTINKNDKETPTSQQPGFLKKRYINHFTTSPKLRLAAVSFLDGSVCVLKPRLNEKAEEEQLRTYNELVDQYNKDLEYYGDDGKQQPPPEPPLANIPFDMSNSEMELALAAHCGDESSSSSSNLVSPLNNNNNNQNQNSPTNNASSSQPRIDDSPSSLSSSIQLIDGKSRQQSTIFTANNNNSDSNANNRTSSFILPRDSSSVVRFLSLNSKYKLLVCSGSRLSSFHISDLSILSGDQPQQLEQQTDSSDKNNSKRTIPTLPPFHDLAKKIRNTLLDVCPAFSHLHQQVKTSAQQQSSTFRQLGLGDLKSVSWSPDEEAVTLCFSNAGVCMFDISGALLFYSWKDHPHYYDQQQQRGSSLPASGVLLDGFVINKDINTNNDNDEGNSSNHDCRKRVICPTGMTSCIWVDNKRLLALDQEGFTATKLELATAAVENFTPENESDGNAVLVGSEAVWQLRNQRYFASDLLNVQYSSHDAKIGRISSSSGGQTSASSTTTTTNPFWEKLDIPEIYLSKNFPLRFGVSSPDGSKTIVCGKRGFVIWSKNGAKWRTFFEGTSTAPTSVPNPASPQSAHEREFVRRRALEQSFTVIAAPVWVGNEVVAVPCEFTNAIPGDDKSCQLGTTGQGAVLLFSAHFTQVLDYNIDLKAKKNTLRNSALLEVLGFDDDARPLVVSCSYRGGTGVEKASSSSSSTKSVINAANHSYILTILNAHGSLSFYNICTLLVSNEIHDQLIAQEGTTSAISTFSGNKKDQPQHHHQTDPRKRLLRLPYDQDPCLSVRIKLTHLPSLLRHSNGNLLGIPFINKNQAIHVVDKAAKATKDFGEKYHKELFEKEKAKQLEREVEEEIRTGKKSNMSQLTEEQKDKLISNMINPELEKMKAKAYQSAVGFNLKRLQNQEAFFVAQATDVKQIFCLAPHLGMVPSPLTTESNHNYKHDTSNYSTFYPPNYSFFIVILLNNGRMLMLDIGSRSSSTMFSQDHGVIFGEILDSSSSSSSATSQLESSSSSSTFITRMWPSFVAQSPESKPIDVLLTYGANGLSGNTFIPSSYLSPEGVTDPSTSAAQGVFSTICPTIFGVFRSQTDICPFDSESCPIAVCGSMPLWVAPRTLPHPATVLYARELSSQWFPVFDVSIQSSMSLHLTVLMPLVLGSFNFALLKSQPRRNAREALQQVISASNNRSEDHDDGISLELLRAVTNQLKRQKSLVESFDCVLYQILHANLNELVAIANNNNNSNHIIKVDRHQLLQFVITFLRAECSSQDFFDICVLTLRKTDETRCEPLFDVLGPPYEMFDHCVANNHLLSALHLLRVIQMYSDVQKKKLLMMENQQQSQQHQMTNNTSNSSNKNNTIPLMNPSRSANSNTAMMKTATTSAVFNSHQQDPETALLHCYNSAKKLFGKILRQHDQSVAIDLIRYLVLIQNELNFMRTNQKSDKDSSSSRKALGGGNKDESSSSSSLVNLPGQQQQQQQKQLVEQQQQQKKEAQQQNAGGGGFMSSFWSMIGFGGATSTTTNNTETAPSTSSQINTTDSNTSVGTPQPSSTSVVSTDVTSTSSSSAVVSKQQRIIVVDDSPSALLLANEDLLNEVFDVAASLIVPNSSSSFSSILRVLLLFDGFGLNPNLFFSGQRFKQQIEKEVLMKNHFRGNAADYLSFVLGSLLTELELPDAEFVVVTKKTDHHDNENSTNHLHHHPQLLKQSILKNSFGLLTPTQMALSERSDTFMHNVVLRLRNLFIGSKCDVHLLMLELILMNKEGIESVLGLPGNDELKKSFVQMIEKDECCAGYRTMVKSFDQGTEQDE